MEGKDSNFKIKYRLSNLSPFDLKYLWSAHPLFSITPDTRIYLPDNIKVRTDWSKHRRPGPLLTEHNWPETIDNQGKEVDLRSVGTAFSDKADKFFTTKLQEGWAALYDEKTEEYVGFSFSPNEVPYLGVWVNQGGWPFQGTLSLNAAIEPCTGCPDRLDIAIQREEYAILRGCSTKDWAITFKAGRTNDILQTFSDKIVSLQR